MSNRYERTRILVLGPCASVYVDPLGKLLTCDPIEYTCFVSRRRTYTPPHRKTRRGTYKAWRK